MNYLSLILGIALLVSYVLLFYNYHVTGRKALLYYSLAWLSLAVPVFSGNDTVYVVGLAFFSSLLWAGNVTALGELFFESETERGFKYLSIVPILLVFLLYPERKTLLFFLFGLWVLSSALLLGFFYRNFLSLSILEGIFGVIVVVSGFGSYLRAPLVPVLVALAAAFESIRLFLRSSFVGDFSIGSIQDVSLELKPGLVMVPALPPEVLSSALVFSRKPSSDPNWFWVTSVEGERSVSPTNLPKILDMAVKFMREAQEAGKKPLIVIEGFDYLVLENGFSSVLKFLSALRDYALLNDATVFLVGEDNFLSERERHLLRNLVG
ncbi:DUF835 domain-containing protein [Thermococcus sp.]